MNHSNHNHHQEHHEVNPQPHHVQKSGQHHNHHLSMVNDFKTRFIISLILLIPILLLSPMIQMFFDFSIAFNGDRYLLLLFSTVMFVYGGYPFLKGAVSELKKLSPAMMSLIALAIIVSYVYSTYIVFSMEGNDFFWELSTLISIMLLGHWIEMKSVLGASRALEALLNLMPNVANVMLEDGSIVEKPTAEIVPGMLLLVRPGERIPLDGSIVQGTTSINESMLTGESMPVVKSVGDEVIGGSINGESVITYRVDKIGKETFIEQVITLVSNAQSSRSKAQRIADKAANLLFYIAVIGGISTMIIWLSMGKDMSFAIERAVTVVIISCPHALGLATPLVSAVSSGLGAKNGLLIRNLANFEQARQIDTVLFDKTGTLTEGKFSVVKVVGFSEAESSVLKYAYAIENNSEHPIATGIISEAKKLRLELLISKDVKAIAGQGLSGTVGSDFVEVVSPGYVVSHNISYDKNAFDTLVGDGNTVVFVLLNKVIIGMIGLNDTIRPTSINTVKSLNALGVRSIMVTGDHSSVAKRISQDVGLTSYIAEVLPHQKSNLVQQYIDDGFKVAMIGDGINDAIALATAHLGVAIGAGTDIAMESADVILVKSNPMDIVTLLKLSKSTHRKMIQNLWWSTGYNIIAIPLAAGILYNLGITLSPALGAVLMSLSTFVVAMNARTLKI